MISKELAFDSIETAAHALAEALAESLRDGIEARGQALLAVSGGRTPKLVFEPLRHMALEWSRVTITLTDERWVPPEHADSNEGLVRRHLLQGPAADAHFVPLYNGAASPEAGRQACEARLRSLPLPFDAVYLGMGPDGHVASLFPGEPAVHVADQRCVAVPATDGRQPRMSLTAPTLLQARRVYLLFAGADKHAVYRKALEPGSPRETPLRLILHHKSTPVHVLHAP